MGRGVGTEDRIPSGSALGGDRITERRSIAHDATLLAAASVFRDARDLRMLTVIDAHRRPVGALLDIDMRSLLFSPYGFALLSNPSFGRNLGPHIRHCPTVPIDAGITATLDAWRMGGGGEGVIVTRDGRFEGVIDQGMLLRLAAERSAEAIARRAERADRIQTASAKFEASARDLSAKLADASQMVVNTSSRMADRARQIGGRTADTAVAASQAAVHMSEIAGRGDALAETLSGVEQQMDDAKRATRQAVDLVSGGTRQVAALGNAADQIGSVSALIVDIAQRTTMLALNATIEAARAGEAGRGFAVVANEVKGLASQTRHAAGSITQYVQRIRHAVDQVSLTQGGMADAVGAVDALSATVAGAVHDQGAATRDISQNVAEASVATDHIGANVREILGVAGSTSDDAARMRELADTLSDRAQSLETHLSSFLAELQAA
jgi:methyl-accepting chemotaxis protein